MDFLEPLDDRNMLGTDALAFPTGDAMLCPVFGHDVVYIILARLGLLIIDAALVVAAEDPGDFHILGAGLAVVATGAGNRDALVELLPYPFHHGDLLGG